MDFPLADTHTSTPDWQTLRKRLPLLASIIGLHAAVFYSVHLGLWQQAAQVVLPRVLHTSMIPAATLPKPTQPNPPQVAPPPTVPVSFVRVEIPDLPRQSTPAPPPPSTVQVESVAKEAPAAPATTANLAAPAPAPVPAAPRMLSSAVHYVQAPQPVYPPISRRLGEQGKVMLKVLINDLGQPEQVEISKSSGYGRLDEAARNAVLKALFSPYRENGRAITVLAIVPIVFELDA